ncbi:uncharacterized protein KIAA0825 homolog isoform X3 [Ascaphus truei]|uniref:uncharacterized protein KIAA0825 homolog isoform X3 n=1 Tax=Ascaphus truei TaxID=8439 RepID=UPI003F5A546B
MYKPEMECGGKCPLDSAFLDCLLDTFPGDLEFQQILGDIDDKLKDNALCMEQCLQDIRLEANEMCTGEVLQNTTDCLQWFNNYTIRSLKQPETPNSEVIEFLRTLQHFLKSTENQEDLILQFLLDLSSHCGISFPSSNGSSFQCTSQTSLHAIEDESSMDVQTAWDEVRLHMRRYLVGKLQCNSDAGNNDSKIQMKIQCLKKLLFLYPESDVLLKYQNIQRNLMVDLLHNYSKRNIDMVLRVYQDAIPNVYSMIKDDLFILSHVIDSPLIIKFINETYFDAVTEEMKTFFEILCETNTEENALHLVKPNKRKHTERVYAFDTTAEGHSRKATDLYLFLHQLKSLSNYIKLFTWLEERVEEASSEILFLSCSTEIKGNIQGILKTDCGEDKGAQAKVNETYVLDESSLLMKETPAFKFGWRNSLKALSHSLLHCMPIEVEDFSIQNLQRGNQEHSSTGGSMISLVSIYKSYDSYGPISEKEKPKKVAKVCFDITEEFDSLLSLALACKDNSLQEIRTCFVEAFCKVTTLVLTRLEEWSKQIPSKAPLKNWFTVLSSAIHVLHHFTYYNEQMSKRPLFIACVQRYQEFISNLQFQVTNYCINVCATSIFQDAESHHWDDNKAFYEGERCSFSIQMWQYFCCGLRHDLWTVLPPKVSQEILTEVLEKSLALLAFRYSQAHPNYKRATQIRIDVTSILLCVENFLWSVCSSVQELTKPSQDSKDMILKIHNHCNSLLIVLAVLTAPLESLHEAFKNGFRESPSNSSEPALVDQLHWLIYIKPDLFPSLVKTPSAGEMAVRGQLKLLLSQPCCNWNLLLETLLHQDCLVAETLLSCSITEMLESEDDMLISEKNNCTDPSLTEVILTVFSYCTLSPKSFTTVLEKYMDQERLWDFLCNLPAYSCREPVPKVIRYLKKILMKSVKGVVKQITSVIHSGELMDNPGSCLHKNNVTESLLKALPEKWNFIPRERKLKKSQESFTRLVAEAVLLVISKLPSIIACLPSPIKYFYWFSEQKISEQYSVLKETGVLVWNVIGIICQILEDGNTIEHMTGSKLSSRSKEKLTTVCECLERTIGKKKCDPKEVAQRVLESIEKQRPKWIEIQLQNAKILSREGDFARQEDSSVLKDQGSGLKLTEQKINMMVLDICHKPGGGEYLRQIYHIIQLNEEHLNEALSFQCPDKTSPHSRPFQLTLASVEDQLLSFNPLHMFTLPSSGVFCESATTEWSWDWSKLLPHYQGLNPTTFWVLLEHRGKSYIL